MAFNRKGEKNGSDGPKGRISIMSLRNAAPATVAFTRYFARPICPKCGSEAFVPEHSAFIGKGGVRHVWLCESCNHQFCTTVEFERMAA
jgi:transposase-like protein